MSFVVPPGTPDPEFREELLGLMQDAIDAGNTRGRQVLLGPSEAGGCPRGIAFKLSYDKTQRPGGWAAHKGTLLHDWSDKAVFSKDARYLSDVKLPQVSPYIAGGTADLYAIHRKTLIDLKFPGDASIVKARNNRVPYAYYAQVNLYCLGVRKLGYPVERVGIFWGPMCGDDLHGKNKGAVLWTWDFDEEFAYKAIDDVRRIQDMLTASGDPQRVMQLLPTREDFCTGRDCWTGNGHPKAICPGSSKGDRFIDPNNPFDR